MCNYKKANLAVKVKPLALPKFEQNPQLTTSKIFVILLKLISIFLILLKENCIDPKHFLQRKTCNVFSTVTVVREYKQKWMKNLSPAEKEKYKAISSPWTFLRCLWRRTTSPRIFWTKCFRQFPRQWRHRRLIVINFEYLQQRWRVALDRFTGSLRQLQTVCFIFLITIIFCCFLNWLTWQIVTTKMGLTLVRSAILGSSYSAEKLAHLLCSAILQALPPTACL